MSRVSGPVVALVACSAICLFVPRPAYATPPQAAAGSSFAAATDAAGPAGDQILQQEAVLEALGQQVQALQQSASATEPATAQTYLSYEAALSRQAAAQQGVDDAAATTYEQTQALGPYQQYASQLRGLNSIVPGLVDAPEDAESLATELTMAKLATQNAYAAYTKSRDTQQSYQNQAAALEVQYTTQSAALATLRSQNQLSVAQATAAEAQVDSAIGAGLGTGINSRGEAANPKALAALQFALHQIGKPYVFGAEGPSSYDCSGLTWAAYQSAGVTIPRIARYQEHFLAGEGHTISPSDLLPGDLIFFSGTNSSDWTSVSHVAMFYGVDASGTALVVEAPFTGEDVKIAPVWWSHFYAAERVVPAVPAASSGGSTSPSPSPTPTPSASASQSPSTSPSPSASTSPSPSPTPSTSPSPSDSPTPSPSDSSSDPGRPSPNPSDGSPSPTGQPSSPASTDAPSDVPSTEPSNTPSDTPSAALSSPDAVESTAS